MKYGLFSILFLCGLSISAIAQEVIPLWENGAPGFEDRRDEPEQAEDYWVKNIHNPSLTVYLPPKEKANGTGVIVIPGGGHRLLVFGAEGVEPAEYLSSLGFTAFVLKHRLGREENSPYKIDVHALEDGQRAMRLVRSRADEYGLNPKRIGMAGFSAGGEVVSLVAFRSGEGDPNASDPIDTINCRPDFIVEIYPGPLGIPDEIDENVPPAFFLCSLDDRSHVRPIFNMMDMYRKVGVSFESHIYAEGGHGYNMGNRSKLQSIQNWPARLGDWLIDYHTGK